MKAKNCFIVIPAFNEEAEIKETGKRVLGSNSKAERILVDKRGGSFKLKFVQNCYLFMKAVIIGKYSQKETSP